MSEKRPDQPRFNPCETVKAAVALPWVNSSLIAQHDIESRSWQPYRDRHGYPTA